jgi:ribosomal-protein-alanine N-acetyltransferase
VSLPNDTEEIASFVLFQRVLEDAEMLTLATMTGAQRKGYARTLLKTAFGHLTQRGIRRCLLDVAADNAAAIALYKALGFREDGRRKAYYKRTAQNKVDAILMSSDLTGL